MFKKQIIIIYLTFLIFSSIVVQAEQREQDKSENMFIGTISGGSTEMTFGFEGPVVTGVWVTLTEYPDKQFFIGPTDASKCGLIGEPIKKESSGLATLRGDFKGEGWKVKLIANKIDIGEKVEHRGKKDRIGYNVVSFKKLKIRQKK